MVFYVCEGTTIHTFDTATMQGEQRGLTQDTINRLKQAGAVRVWHYATKVFDGGMGAFGAIEPPSEHEGRLASKVRHCVTYLGYIVCGVDVWLEVDEGYVHRHGERTYVWYKKDCLKVGYDIDRKGIQSDWGEVSLPYKVVDNAIRFDYIEQGRWGFIPLSVPDSSAGVSFLRVYEQKGERYAGVWLGEQWNISEGEWSRIRRSLLL